MKEQYFVNEALDKAISSYLSSKHDEESILYNSFLVVVIRILVLIYGEVDIINPRELRNGVALFNNLGKYGMSSSDIALFMEDFLAYYKFAEDNKENTNVKNPYFVKIIKSLVDMFVFKKKSVLVSFEDEEAFLELSYTAHTKNAAMVSLGKQMLDDENYIEKYYYSKLNAIDETRELSLGRTITEDLNLEALKNVGVNLSDIGTMSLEELAKAKDKAYNVDMNEKGGRTFSKLSTGNGYVDILLLMSIIITSLSVVAILIFSRM